MIRVCGMQPVQSQGLMLARDGTPCGIALATLSFLLLRAFSFFGAHGIWGIPKIRGPNIDPQIVGLLS